MFKMQKKDEKGITLIALVITIIVLIILAGIAISMTIGENGIFTKAKEAKRLQITAEAKEKIGTEILAAQVEAIERNEELEQAQVEDIISKYGTLQDDKDTIILKDSGYEISLLDIYQGTTTSSGSYSENKAKIELLEGQVKRLQEQLDSTSQNGDEKDKKIAELNEKITTVENEKAVLQNENNALSGKVDEMSTEITSVKQQINLMNDDLSKRGKTYYSTTLAENIIPANTEKELAKITVPESGTYLLMAYCYASASISSNISLKFNGTYWWDLFFSANVPSRPMYTRPMTLSKGDTYSLVLDAKSVDVEIQTPQIILTRLY